MHQFNTTFKPKELWRSFKTRMVGKYVGPTKIIKRVNELYLNRNVVDDNAPVPNLKVGKNNVFAVVTFGVLLCVLIKMKKK
jgi:hypothetical protein